MTCVPHARLVDVIEDFSSFFRQHPKRVMVLPAAGLCLSLNGTPPIFTNRAHRYQHQTSSNQRTSLVVRASSADSSFSHSGGSSSSSNNSDNYTSNKSLITAVGIPLVSGLVVAAFNRPDTWYFQLKKPAWTPPAPIFGLAWSLIYPLMGVASWLVWERGGWEKQALPLTLYALQLMANLLWQVAFFGLRNPSLAFKDICVLGILIALCVAAFRKVNPKAADLMKIYLAWVVFAAVLNFRILKDNPPLVAGGASPPGA